MLYIGIDLGTSSVKLLLMDADGRILKTVSEEYPLYFPRTGWSEQDPNDWTEAAVRGLLELTDGCPKDEVAGISFGGQMHGLVALDENDAVIRPAILWNDGRTEEETKYLNNDIGKEKLTELTGNIAFAGFTAPKLLWMRKHEPENFARIKKIMLPKDYIAYCLSGSFCTDFSDASGTLLLDVEHKCWSAEMLDICGIKEEMLPELYESWETVGVLRKDIASQLGLRKDVKISAGAGDNAAAAVGTGTVGGAGCSISLGTSGTIFIPTRFCRADPQGALHSFAHADGAYHLMGCMLSAASCSKWWIENILKTGDQALEQGKIKTLGENNVFFLPYLMGERSPHNDPSARAAFIGMSMDTAREDMTLAVLEGVAFGLRDCLEAASEAGARPEAARLCGGGAKSDLWRRIIASVLDMNVELIETQEGPGYGAAMLAAVGCGEFGSVEEAARKLVRVTKTIRPDPLITQKYEEKYQYFRKLYPALREAGGSA